MIKKDIALKYKEFILNCVRFHAPICFSADINRTVLFSHGINLDYPIFVYENAVDDNLIYAFKEALKEENFNLLVPIEILTNKQERKLNKKKNNGIYSRN